jgi:hypothetical protein
VDECCGRHGGHHLVAGAQSPSVTTGNRSRGIDGAVFDQQLLGELVELAALPVAAVHDRVGGT